MSNNKFTSVVPNGEPNAPLLGKPKTFPRNGLVGRMKNMVSPLKHEPNRREGLVKAITDGNEDEAIRLIRETGMKLYDLDDGRFIYYAYSKNEFGIIKALIEAGVSEPEEGFLIRAVRDGNVEKVRGLLTAGVDIRKRDTYGSQAIHYALDKNSEIMRMLIAAGANVNAETYNQYDKTPLQKMIDLRNSALRSKSAGFNSPELPEIEEKIKMLEAAGARAPAPNPNAWKGQGGRKRTKKYHSKKRKTRRKA
jgi:hypothetical protein